MPTTWGRITINGNGTQARAFIHIDEIARLLATLITTDVIPGVYNVSAHNYQILELVDVLKKVYPPLEFIFVNQHLNLRGIRIQPNHEFMSSLGFNQAGDLEQEIRAFAKHLPFGGLSAI